MEVYLTKTTDGNSKFYYMKQENNTVIFIWNINDGSIQTDTKVFDTIENAIKQYNTRLQNIKEKKNYNESMPTKNDKAVLNTFIDSASARVKANAVALAGLPVPVAPVS